MSEPRVDNFHLPQTWLRPYVAVSLLRAPADLDLFRNSEEHFLNLLEEAIRDRRSSGDRLRRLMPVKKAEQGGWRISGFVFQQLTAPLWLKVDQPEERTKAADAAQAYFDRFKDAEDPRVALQDLDAFVTDPAPLCTLGDQAAVEKKTNGAIDVLRQLCGLLLSAAPENRHVMLERYLSIVDTYEGSLKPVPALIESMLRDWNEAMRIRDTRYDLALLCVREKYGAIVSTDGRTRQGFRTRLLANRNARADGKPLFEEVPEDLMASAFLRGHARQTWLEGLHAPVITKASAKTLLGPDLRSAFDPFGDQTFRLAGALSSMERGDNIDFIANLPVNSPLRDLNPDDAIGAPDKDAKKRVVGVSFDRGVVWTGSSSGIKPFVRQLEELCLLVDKAEEDQLTNPSLGFRQRGYHTLLVPERRIRADALGNVVHFDLPLSLPGENVDANDDEPDVQKANEDWLRFGDFQITKQDATCAYVDAIFCGKAVANIRIQPRISSEGVADLEITIVSERGPDDEARVLLDRVLSSMRSRATLWFEAGYAIRRQRVFKLNFRDVEFSAWNWLPFSRRGLKFKVSEEKPFRLVPKGKKTDKQPIRLEKHDWKGLSLFDYVVRNVQNLFGFGPGSFLLSDDGSKEIADFIYIDAESPRIVLIHAKGASESANRDIAPGMYELVLQQAIKNAEFLDIDRLADTLDQKLNTVAATLTWEGDGRGKTGNRPGAVKLLRKINKLAKKTVVILQPHVTQKTWDEYDELLRKDKLPASKRIQYLRLKMLLAENSYFFGRIPAGFEVWGEYDPKGTGMPRFAAAQLS